MSKCISCHHPVSSGGNQHASGRCPPARKLGKNHTKRKRNARRKAQEKYGDHIVRGVAVAGTGKPSASSSKSKT